jgi:Na+/H+ antiporter NhaD/arsenite permease-like protein
VDPVVLGIFVLVYLGMMLGGFPGMALDRTGIALLGAIALVAAGRMTVQDAWNAVDVPTLGLLFGLMVVSSQLRLGGFYAAVTGRIAGASLGPSALLAVLVLAAGGLSAVLANDIVCLAMAPILVHGCARRGLDPVPYLLALAAAANVGSAATLIGNPQNMLVGQTLHLHFTRYLALAAVPSFLGLVAVWGIVRLVYRHDRGWSRPLLDVPAPRLDRAQTAKGIAVTAGLMVAFVVAPWPREAVALAGAGVLLASRKTASRPMLALVDWHLLVLFVGLFVVNHALTASGMPAVVLHRLEGGGLDPAHPARLFVLTAALSNLVSNVPAVMLLLPAAHHPAAGPVLALSSTLAGNLVLVGSIANLIVAEQASAFGVSIGWREHARVGVPITLVTLLMAGGWLWLVGGG